MFFLLDLDIVWKLCIMLNANVDVVGFIFTVPCWYPQLWVHYRLICPRYYYWARTLWIHDKRFWNRCGKLEFKVTGEERHSLLTQYLKVYISVFTQNHFYWCQYTFSIVIRKTISNYRPHFHFYNPVFPAVFHNQHSVSHCMSLLVQWFKSEGGSWLV